MIIRGDNVSGIDDLKLQLVKQSEMKDLGTLRYLLGVEIDYSPKSYLLYQSKYIANTLEQARFSDTTEENISLELNVKYSPSDGVTQPNPILYRLYDYHT